MHQEKKTMYLKLKYTIFIFLFLSGYAVFAQVGINTTDPRTMLDVKGNVSLNAGTLTLNSGNNNVTSNDHTPFNISGPSADFNINTIQPLTDVDGQIITLVNTTSHTMALVHNDGAGANSIFCPNGNDLVLEGIYTTVTLQYNKSLQRWTVMRYADRSAYQRTIYSSAGTTDIQTNPVGFTDMEEMSITFTPKNSVVYVNFGAAGFMYLDSSTTEQGYGDFRLVNVTASNKVVAGSTVIATDVDYLAVSTSFNIRMNMIPVSVTPGQSTTLKIQWRNGGVNPDTLLCPATETDYAHRNITIFD